MGRWEAIKGITFVSHAHRPPTYLLYQSQIGPRLYNMGGGHRLDPCSGASVSGIYSSGLVWLKVTEIQLQLTLEKMIPHCLP